MVAEDPLQLLKRPGHGTKGQPISVFVNLFKMAVGTDAVCIYEGRKKGLIL